MISFICQFTRGIKHSSSSSSSSSSSKSFLNRLAKGIEKSAKDHADKNVKENVQLFSEKLSELDQDPSLQKAREHFTKGKKELLEENKALLEDIKKGKQFIKDGITSSKKVVSKVCSPIYDNIPSIDTTFLERGVDNITSGIHKVEESLLGSSMDKYGGFRKRSIKEKKRLIPNNDVTSIVTTTTTTGLKNINFDLPTFRINDKLRKKWEESDNVFVFLLRRTFERVSDVFSSLLLQETDQAKCIREIRNRIPDWKEEEFSSFLSGSVFPTLLEALIEGDVGTLRSYLSDAPFAQLKSALSSSIKAGLKPNGRILDMRNVELITGNLTSNNPTLIYTFQTQQTSFMTIKEADGTQRIEGDPNRIENYFYVIAISLTDDTSSPLLGGWKIVEFAMRER